MRGTIGGMSLGWARHVQTRETLTFFLRRFIQPVFPAGGLGFFEPHMSVSDCLPRSSSPGGNLRCGKW